MANIQIHELNALTGAPASSDVLAIDNGTTTSKVTFGTLKGNITDGIQADISGIQADIAAITSDVTDLQTDVTDIQGDVATLESDMATAKGNITTLQGDVSTLQGDVADIQDDVADLQAQVESIANTVNAITPVVSADPASIVTLTDGLALPAEGLMVGIRPTVTWTGPAFYTEKRLPVKTAAQPDMRTVSIAGPCTIYVEYELYEDGVDVLHCVYASVSHGSESEYNSVISTSHSGKGIYSGLMTIPSGSTLESLNIIWDGTIETGVEGWPITVRVAVLSGTYDANGIAAYRVNNPVTITGWTGANVNLSDGTGTPSVTSVSWQAAGTVYYGVLDVVNGTLTVTHKGIVVDGTNIAFTETSTQFRFNDTALSDAVSGSRCFASWLPSTTMRVNAPNHFVYGYKTDYSNLGITTLEQLNQLCVANPLVVIYELATSQPYTLTPAQITLLNGDNTIWADCGDTALTYRANPYIRLLNMIENAT